MLSLSSSEPAFLHCGVHFLLPMLPLPIHDLLIKRMDLFLFFLAKTALMYLPTAHGVALRPHFHFWQAQYVQVFLLKPAPFCKLFTGPGSPNKSSVSLLFSSSPTLAMCLLLCPLLRFSFYLKLFDRSCRNCLLFPPVLSAYNGSSDTSFFSFLL